MDPAVLIDSYDFNDRLSYRNVETTDGTGNNARDFEPKFDPEKDIDRSITNVLKLHLLAGGGINNRRNDVPGQISLYKREIGGETDENMFVSNLNMAKGDLSQHT